MDGHMLPGAVAISLPDDIIFNILSRMPVKPVCRFRCASKGWRGLISSPAFLAAHKSLHNAPFLVDAGYFRGNKERDLRLMDMDGNVVRVIQGVGGRGVLPMTSLDYLVCVVDGHSGGGHVVDPATGDVLVSSPGLEVIKSRGYSVTRQYETFGIGRTTLSGVYKVVRLVGGDFCYVFTIGDDRGWRKTRAPPRIPFLISILDRHRSPVTINGVMYFLTDGIPSNGTLLCFDLQTEQWKNCTIKGPEMTRTESVYITELDGALCMVQREYDDARQELRDPKNSCTNLWMLDDSDKGNWTKAYTIPKGPQGCRYFPLRVMHDGEKLLVQCVTVYHPFSSALQVYDPCTKTCVEFASTPKYLHGKIGLCSLNLEHLVSVKN